MAARQSDGLFSLRGEGFAAVAVRDGADEAVLFLWGEVGAVDGLEAGLEEDISGGQRLFRLGHGGGEGTSKRVPKHCVVGHPYIIGGNGGLRRVRDEFS